MTNKLKAIKHIAYYTSLVLLAYLAISLVYCFLPPVVGKTLQAISGIILGLMVPVHPEKTA